MFAFVVVVVDGLLIRNFPLKNPVITGLSAWLHLHLSLKRKMSLDFAAMLHAAQRDSQQKTQSKKPAQSVVNSKVKSILFGGRGMTKSESPFRTNLKSKDADLTDCDSRSKAVSDNEVNTVWVCERI